MASQTPYARVDSFEQQEQDAQIRPAATPLQFSGEIPGHVQSDPQLTAQWTSKKSTFFRARETNSGSSDGLPPYQDFIGLENGGTRPKRPKRVRTTGSFISVASSAWRSTRDFAVSNFTVPRVGAPWEHEIREKSIGGGHDSNTVRHFDYRRQRRRLFINSTFQFMTTLFLCAALVGALYGFSTIITGLSNGQKKGFNALITGLSICLGLNLASSLKGYAQMMRWRFLASGYRTLQDFELVMQCESQSKVFRLIWAGRTRGQWFPNKTQVLAFVWILINVALQIVTALLGLAYSIDIAQDYTHLVPGNVSIADLTCLSVDSCDFNVQAAAMNSFGVTGLTYTSVPSDGSQYAAQEDAYFRTDDFSSYWYDFVDRNPFSWSENVVSSRRLYTTATCREMKLTFGGYAGFDERYDADGLFSGQYIHFTNDEGKDERLYMGEEVTGATTWLAYYNNSIAQHTCGPRCAYMYALQTADNYTVTEPQLWQCNNTISALSNWDYYGAQDIVDLPDPQAHLIAGSIAWSGFTTDENNYQSNVYSPSTPPSPDSGQTAFDMSSIIMAFTAGAISAYDQNGAKVNITTSEQPTPAQVVDVDWKWASIILAVIPAVQFIVLVCVIGWANKAVIKDTSFLATAKLLAPVVNKLGEKGCLLTGDEIAEELGNYRIIYGPRFPTGYDGRITGPAGVGGVNEEQVVKHIDVIAEEEGVERWHGRMPAGHYDGTSTWKKLNDQEREALLGVERKRRSRRSSL